MPATNHERAIDAWAQPALKHFIEDVPEAARLFKQSHTSHIVESGITADQMVASMDAAGVERAMLCAWHRPGKSLTTNDEIAEIVARFPDRFVGVAAVNLEKPVEAVRELDRAVNRLGFKALRVIPWLWNRPPNDKLYANPIFGIQVTGNGHNVIGGDVSIVENPILMKTGEERLIETFKKCGPEGAAVVGSTP